MDDLHLGLGPLPRTGSAAALQPSDSWEGAGPLLRVPGIPPLSLTPCPHRTLLHHGGARTPKAANAST